MELPMNKTNRFHIASSLVLLAIFFSSYSTFAQIPKLFLKFVEKQNEVQSGHAKLQYLYMTDNDTTWIQVEETFFISTPKDLKYLTYYQSSDRANIYCKSAHTFVGFYNLINYNYTRYRYDDEIYDAKEDGISEFLSYPTAYGISLERFKNGIFQRIPSKIDKNNIRYRIVCPDNEEISNISQEYEFDRKTFNLIQQEFSLIYFETESIYSRTDIFGQRLYDYIHPDILDTISFTFEDIKKGYDQQYAMEQSKKDSAFRAHLYDSIAQSITKDGRWVENIFQEVPQETLFFMPEWKFPLLSGDTIYSNSINSRFLLIDMWYIACHPCRLAMVELSSIDTLYNESLLKIVSLNVVDKDTARMRQVVKNLNLKCDVACAYNNGYDFYLSKELGTCQGYPQLYLIEMKTKQVIWHSCGYYAGFTKDIGEIITAKE